MPEFLREYKRPLYKAGDTIEIIDLDSPNGHFNGKGFEVGQVHTIIKVIDEWGVVIASPKTSEETLLWYHRVKPSEVKKVGESS